jgi:hypothetical protein
MTSNNQAPNHVALAPAAPTAGTPRNLDHHPSFYSRLGQGAAGFFASPPTLSMMNQAQQLPMAQSPQCRVTRVMMAIVLDDQTLFRQQDGIRKKEHHPPKRRRRRRGSQKYKVERECVC